MDVKINYKNKNIKIKNLTECKSIFSRTRGLMFRKKIIPLIFKFKRPVRLGIHSLFVFNKFVAIWIKNNKVIDVKIIKPWKPFIKINKEFDTLIELPIEERKRFF